MNLYRLDTPSGPVNDLIGVALIRQASKARETAKMTAKLRGEPVTVTRISGAGSMRQMYTVHPS